MNATPPSFFLSGIDAIILCGGFGKRLQPVVSDRQKVLAEVIGQPFLLYLLDQISDAGGKKVILCTGYMADQLEHSLGSAYKSLSLTYSREPKPLGTGGAIINALDRVTSDPFLVMNGDSFCDINLKQLLEWHIGKKSSCTLTLVKVTDSSRYGCVNFDDHFAITSFVEKKPGSVDGWINAGVYCMARDSMVRFPKNKNISIEKDVFPSLIGGNFFAFPQEAKFIDIGTPASYREAETFFAGGRKHVNKSMGSGRS